MVEKVIRKVKVSDRITDLLNYRMTDRQKPICPLIFDLGYIKNKGKIQYRYVKLYVRSAYYFNDILENTKTTDLVHINHLKRDPPSHPHPFSRYLIFPLVMKKTTTSLLHTFLHPYWHGTHPSNVSMFIPQVVEMVCCITTSSPVIIWTATCYVKHLDESIAIAIVSLPLLQINVNPNESFGEK